MSKTLVLLLMLSAVAFGQIPVLPGTSNAADGGKMARRIWYVSLGAVAAANVLDIQSSWGKRETNGLLAGPGGAFTARSVGIKLGIQAPLLAFEFWQIRRAPRKAAFISSAVANFAMSAVYTGTAVHNYGVPGPR